MSQEPIQKRVADEVQHTVEEAQQEVAETRAPWYSVSRRTRILSLIYFTVFVLFSLLAWYVHSNPLINVDIAITREFQESTTPWLQITMIAVSYLGYQLVLFGGLILVTGIVFWVLRLRLEALLIVTLSTISALLNDLLKFIVGRPRPATPLIEIIVPASGPSFPSGHVMSYVAYWGLLFSLGLILFKRNRWWHYVLLIVPALFVLLVGPSRIYLGDHWASDVLGGYLFGGLLLGISLRIYLVLREHGVLQDNAKRQGKPG